MFLIIISIIQMTYFGAKQEYYKYGIRLAMWKSIFSLDMNLLFI